MPRDDHGDVEWQPPSRTIQPLQVYDVRLTTPNTITQIALKGRLETNPPGMTGYGTWQIQQFLEQSSAANGRTFWKIRARWYGKAAALPWYVTGDDYEYMDAFMTVPPNSGPPLLPVWRTVLDRRVRRGVRYKFLIVGPNNMDQSQTTLILAQNGWNVESVTEPPPAMQKSLERIGKAGAVPPKVWLVVAIWANAPTQLSQNDISGSFFGVQTTAPVTYAQTSGVMTLQEEYYVYSEATTVPPPPIQTTTEGVIPPQSTPSVVKQTKDQQSASPIAAVAAIAAGAAIIGSFFYAWRRGAFGGLLRNPIRYESTVQHRSIPIHIHSDDLAGYCADYRALDRYAPGAGGVVCSKSFEDALGQAKRRIDAAGVN